MADITKKSATAANLVQMTKSFIENLKNPRCKTISFYTAAVTVHQAITLPFNLDLSVPYPIMSISVTNEATTNASCRLQDECAEVDVSGADNCPAGATADMAGYKIGAANATTRSATKVCIGRAIDAHALVTITAVWAEEQTLSA